MNFIAVLAGLGPDCMSLAGPVPRAYLICRGISVKHSKSAISKLYDNRSIRFSWNPVIVMPITGQGIDLIHDTRHLCTRFRIDGIKF